MKQAFSIIRNLKQMIFAGKFFNMVFFATRGKARFKRRILHAPNAIQTMHNEEAYLIIYCLNCIRYMQNSTFETGLSYLQNRYLITMILWYNIRFKFQQSVMGRYLTSPAKFNQSCFQTKISDVFWQETQALGIIGLD